MIRARILIPTLVSVLLAAPTAAQERADVVPRELVSVLLRGWSSTTPAPEVVGGRAPEGFPTEVIPAGARILGGTSQLEAEAKMVAVTLPQPPAEAAATLASAATGAGWARVPDSGFPREVDTSRTLAFCRDGRLLAATVGARPEGGGSHAMLAHVSGPKEAGLCNPAAETPAEAPREMIPPLAPPPDARTVSGAGTSSWSGYIHEMTTDLDTRMTAAEVAAHYAAQIERAGWAPAGSSSDGPVAVRAFRHRGRDGREWHGSLVVLALGDTDRRDVVFRIRRHSPD